MPYNRNDSNWGWFALGSVILWLLIFVAILGSSSPKREIANFWFAGRIGGMGTVLFLLSSLYKDRIVKPRFTQRYAIACLILPFLGFTAGVITYGISVILSLTLVEEMLEQVWIQAMQYLLGGIIGYQIIGKSIFEKYVR